MKAIILAAGVGRRLGGSVVEHPKCLLELEGRSLLDRMLDALNANGVTEITVVVGHLGDQIVEAVAGREGVRTVFNPEFRKGAILSLWAAREDLDSDVLVMDADVLFPVEMLRRLVDSPAENCFLMDVSAENDGEAQMLMARGGRVLDITRGLRGDYDACGESIGFLKLSRDGAATLRRLLERALTEGRDGIEHEEVYPALMRECVIGYVTAEDLPWLEIDFPEDVDRARALLQEQAGVL
ncbi:MAG: NTP transferase domain-containing protein [Actinomycetota bacterium]